GYETEAIMPRGAKTDQGEFLDVHLMRLLID
ncbi:MAG TPA: GNAT family N-acetyltransferase, partial [Enterococcus faecalis]|nr:GNAT family N-acetyltransferase [Enterococcus faecalis]